MTSSNSPIPDEFPAQRPVTRSFDVFFDLRPNRWLSKQWWGWWFETSSRHIWRHCNVIVMSTCNYSCGFRAIMRAAFEAGIFCHFIMYHRHSRLSVWQTEIPADSLITSLVWFPSGLLGRKTWVQFVKTRWRRIIPRLKTRTLLYPGWRKGPQKVKLSKYARFSNNQMSIYIYSHSLPQSNKQSNMISHV